MFQTLQPQTTSRLKNTLPNKFHKLYLDNEIELRPKTVGFQKNPLQTFTPKSNFFKSIDTAELQLTTEFQNQMSPFIKEKIRSSLSRNSKRRVILSRGYSNYQDPEQSDLLSSINQSKFYQTIDSLNQTSPITNRSFKISSIFNRETKSPFRQQQMIHQPLLTNAKEKIDRLIGMKRQKDLQFESLKNSIQRKYSKAKQNNSKKITLMLDSSRHKPPTMQTLQWDQQWKEETKKQSNRYRNRLLSKHKRQNCVKIQICEQKLAIQV